MKFKRLFTHALAAAPGRLHMAAHSHHLWPDVTREAQIACWDDAAILADRKWEKIMGEVWGAARANVARELNLPSPETVVFAPNTHELITRLVSAFPKRPLKALSTDGEFHSFRRQSARWVESGTFDLDLVPCEPFDDFEQRFLERAKSGGYDLIFVSQVFFRSGRVFEKAQELARLSKPEGPWVVIDGYHGFLTIPTDLKRGSDRVFFMAGGYKYAMAGEGAAFMHAPPGYGPRPEITGWYAEFADLEGPQDGVGFGRGGDRFMGATFDPSGLYRFNAVFQMLADEGLSTAAVSAHVDGLQEQFLDLVASGEAGPFKDAELLNPRNGKPHARFLAFRHPDAQAWKAALMEANAVTDVRDDVLRVGLGLYHDPEDVDRFAGMCKQVLSGGKKPQRSRSAARRS